MKLSGNDEPICTVKGHALRNHIILQSLFYPSHAVHCVTTLFAFFCAAESHPAVHTESPPARKAAATIKAD